MRMLPLLLCLGGCSPEPPELTCVELHPGCTPLYAPRFSEIFSRTLEPTCAQQGGVCHAADGARAGLVFSDVDTAYQALLSTGFDGNPRINLENPGCSTLLRRLGASERSLVMPPGMPLGAEEICAFELWISGGAER